jgi:cyclohexyl-isocyanide hydratase
MRHDEY